MRFGMYFFLQAPAGRSSSNIIVEEVAQMVLAEDLGYDSVWLTEHHYADYGLSSAPTVLMATVAARTRRVHLGTAVYVIPFHNPLRLAEETATIDILSGGGRLTVGLGRGNRPLEFFGHGVPQQESRSRMEEGVAVLLQAWTEDRVNFHGKHWKIEGVPVHPKPASRPHPPLAFAVTSAESIAWAAEHGFAMLSSGLGTPLAGSLASRKSYIETLQATNHSPEEIDALLARWVLTKHVYVAPTDAEAAADARGPEMWYRDSFIRSMRADNIPGLHPSVYEQADAAMTRLRAQTWEWLLDNALLIGSPDTVANKVAELQEVGVGELACWMNFGGVPPEKARRSMRLFADEVMPRFQSAARPAMAQALPAGARTEVEIGD